MSERDALRAENKRLWQAITATQDAMVSALVELARADNHGAVQAAVNVFREECDRVMPVGGGRGV